MEDWSTVPPNLRGMYVLHQRGAAADRFNVVYVGMATSNKDGGIFRRIRSHANSISKKSKWTHFSFFVVWDNIRNEEISELESLFRGIYQKDEKANSLNKQRGNKKIASICRTQAEWSNK
jgi:hypothetical protein